VQGEPEAVDLRQFLLGACTCLDMDKSRKTQFVFDLYDDDRSGFLSTAELTQVLIKLTYWLSFPLNAKQ
jgi:Ca2+-binding EF-hand superfamily protein